MKDFKNMSKTYCPLPFIHFAVKPDGGAKPCCRFSTFFDKEAEIRNWSKVNHNLIGAENVLNSQEFLEVRETMLNGEKVPGCWKCYKEEETIGYSMRTRYNDKFPNHDNTVKLKYLEISFGNYCNLSCRTCNSNLSTTWYNDDLELSKKYKDRSASKKIIDVSFNWDPKDFEHVQEIKFVGGEPMLNPNFGKFLETVLETGRGKSIKLTIFTNSSWFPKPKIIELLKKFESVFIWLSIDSFGRKNDYIRHGSNWETLSSVALKYLDLERETKIFSVVLTPTLNILNITDIDSLVSWWYRSREERELPCFKSTDDNDFQTSLVVFSIVYDPEVLSVKNLPDKNSLIVKYKNIIAQSKNHIHYDVLKQTYNKVIRAIEQDINKEIDLRGFVEFTKDLDKLRQQNFKEIFPDLHKMIEKELNKNNLSYDLINGKLND